MIETLRKIVAIAKSYQLSALFMPCPDSFKAQQGKIDHLLQVFPPNDMGLCLDLGYLCDGSGAPVEILKKYGARLGHLYIKSIEDCAYQFECLNASRQSCSSKAFCPIDESTVKYREVFNTLENINYAGWVIIDSPSSQHESRPQVLRSISRSYSFISEIGSNLN